MDKELKKVKEWIIGEMSNLLSSVTMPILERITNNNIKKAIKQNQKLDDKQELKALKKIEEIYNIIKKW